MLHGFCWYFDILNFSPLSHLNGKMTGTRIVMVDNELLPIILAMGSSAFYFFYDGLYCRGAFNDQQSPLILLDPILSYLGSLPLQLRGSWPSFETMAIPWWPLHNAFTCYKLALQSLLVLFVCSSPEHEIYESYHIMH